MASPESREVPSGRKNGWISPITVRAANSPLWRIMSKNTGPPPPESPFASTTTGRMARAARPTPNTYVRGRWIALPISTRNIGALHQAHEDVLQTLPFGGQDADLDPAGHERTGDRRRRRGRAELDEQ